MAWRQGRVLSGLRRLSVLPSLTFEPEIHAENGKFHIPENSSLNLCSSPLNLLYASLTIPLVYCHSKSFQRVSSVARPEHGGENMTAVWPRITRHCAAMGSLLLTGSP